MKTDTPITSQTLHNYLDNYIVEKKVVCQHNNRKGQHNNSKGQPKQPKGHSRTRNTVSRSRKQSISQTGSQTCLQRTTPYPAKEFTAHQGPLFLFVS